MGRKKSTDEEVIIDIETYADNIDEEKAKKFYEKSRKEAEKILEDEDKMERFLQRLERKLKTVPIAGNALAYVPLMMSLVKSYVKKEYKELPVGTMISIVIALIYFLSPVDLILDTIPVVGFLDDGAVIIACLAFVRTDLEDYRKWRKDNGLEIDDLPDYDDLAKDSEKYNRFANAFFKNKK